MKRIKISRILFGHRRYLTKGCLCGEWHKPFIMHITRYDSKGSAKKIIRIWHNGWCPTLLQVKTPRLIQKLSDDRKMMPISFGKTLRLRRYEVKS